MSRFLVSTSTDDQQRQQRRRRSNQRRSGSSSASSSSSFFRRMMMTSEGGRAGAGEDDDDDDEDDEYIFSSNILDLPSSGAETAAPAAVVAHVEVEDQYDDTTTRTTSTTDRDVTNTFDDSFMTEDGSGGGGGIDTAVVTSLVYGRNSTKSEHEAAKKKDTIPIIGVGGDHETIPIQQRYSTKYGSKKSSAKGHGAEYDNDDQEDDSSLPVLYYNGQDTSELIAEKRLIKMVVIASNVIKIEDQAFRGWTNLQRVVLEENYYKTKNKLEKDAHKTTKSSKLTIIGDRAFSDCTSLQDVDFIWKGSSKVKKIQAYAFAGCHSLKGDIKLFQQEPQQRRKEELQDGTTAVKDDHDLNSSLVSVYDELLTDNEAHTKQTVSKKKKKTMVDRSTSSLQLIGPYAFSRCSEITSIRIPDHVSYIGMGAFSDCVSLLFVNLPTEIRVVGASTFARCKKFGSDSEYPIIAIPPNVTSIGPEAFWGCEAMERIKFSHFNTNGSLRIIKNGAFQRCKSLKKVILPDSVQRIGPYAFGTCSSLKYIRLPPGLEKLDDGVFQFCTLLHGIDCKAIPIKALLRPSNISKSMATKHDYLEHDESYSLKEDFSYCGPLQEIGDLVFESSDSIRFSSSSSIPLSHLTGRSELSGNLKNDDSMDLPVGLRSLGDYCFEGCESLSYIDLQYMEVQSIGACAFSDCTSLMKVALSDGTKYVGERCFGGCEKLQDVMVAMDGTYGSAVFAGCSNLKRFFDADGTKYSFRNGRSDLLNALVEQDDCDDLIGTLLESGHFDLSDLTRANRDILSDKVYRSHALQRAIGCLGSGRFAVFFHMIDLYMNIFVTGLFIYVSHEVLIQHGHPVITRLIFLPIAYFALLECVQIRYDGISYFVDVWNLGDWTRIAFITVTTWFMVDLTFESDPTHPNHFGGSVYDIPNYLRLMIMFTGFVSIYGFILSFRSIFLPLAEFVGGIGEIFYKLIPFMLVSSLMLFMFGFMYFAIYSGSIDPDLLVFSSLDTSDTASIWLFLQRSRNNMGILAVRYCLRCYYGHRVVECRDCDREFCMGRRNIRRFEIVLHIPSRLLL